VTKVQEATLKSPSRAAAMIKGRHWALMGQGPCGGPLRLDFPEVPFTPAHQVFDKSAHGVPVWRRAGKALVLALPAGARRSATSRGLAHAARRTTRPAKGQAAALRWGALAEACTRVCVLVHGRAVRSSSDRRRGSTLPVRRGVAFRANTCKHTGSGRSPARTHQSSRVTTTSC
jgi:hypothetical protein